MERGGEGRSKARCPNYYYFYYSIIIILLYKIYNTSVGPIWTRRLSVQTGSVQEAVGPGPVQAGLDQTGCNPIPFCCPIPATLSLSHSRPLPGAGRSRDGGWEWGWQVGAGMAGGSGDGGQEQRRQAGVGTGIFQKN